MPKFYEIKLITFLGYFLLFICSIIGFFGGRGVPEGLILIPLPFFIVLGFTIYYIKLSKENKYIHILCFSILIFILTFFIGVGISVNKRVNIKNILLEANNIVEEYQIEKNIKTLSEEDYEILVFPENIRIEEYIDNKYRLIYDDGIFYCKYFDGKIHIWSTWQHFH